MHHKANNPLLQEIRHKIRIAQKDSENFTNDHYRDGYDRAMNDALNIIRKAAHNHARRSR